MTVQIRTILPDDTKIRTAARAVKYIAPGDRLLVYAMGHGGMRDWNYGVGTPFIELYDNLRVVQLEQPDVYKTNGYRPILGVPDSLAVKGAEVVLLFDTSAKEYIQVDEVKIPSSSTQLGVWTDILTYARELGISSILSMLTIDSFGISTVPIEHEYRERRITPIGPRSFVELNLVSTQDAYQALRDWTLYGDFRTRLAQGRIEPTKLRKYERYLREHGIWTRDTALEEEVIPNLDLIEEGL